MLYIGKIAIWLIIIAGLIYGVLRLIKRRKEVVKTIPRRNDYSNLHLKMAGFGLASSVLLTGFWYVTINIFDGLGRWIGYGNQGLIIPLLILVIIVLFVGILFGPSIYIGVKHGSKYGMITFTYTIGWLILLIILTITIYSILNPPQIYY